MQPEVRYAQGEEGHVAYAVYEVGEFFDATRLEVDGEIAVEDGRFYIGIVTGGSGTLEGEFGSRPVRRGETFACAATMAHRFRSSEAGALTVVRCLGPRV